MFPHPRGALIEADDAPKIPGVESPSELYWVLREPAPFAGMCYPRGDFPWKSLEGAGFVGVVSLHGEPDDPSPLAQLCSVELEDLCHGGVPRDVAREERRIAQAVDAVVGALQDGRGVVVHCCGGTGRTGTVIGCALRRLGYDASEIVSYLDRLHKARGKGGWPESQWQKSLVSSHHCEPQKNAGGPGKRGKNK